MPDSSFNDLCAVARHLRTELAAKKIALIFGYNGIGKTRLSLEFKNLGKQRDADGNITVQDTLYFNAFTEDLFFWDNDLKNDRERVLKLNRESRFFAGLEEQDMQSKIRPLVNQYADFYFAIDTKEWEVSFSRDVTTGDGVEAKTTRIEDIKVSRGEENIFIWCFFLAIVQMALDDEDGTGPYGWVKYIYIDDPISSLDDTNAIAVASNLAQLLTNSDTGPRAVISTHHGLFLNVLTNELAGKKYPKYFLKVDGMTGRYVLKDLLKGPFLHHLTTLVELTELGATHEVRRHHFNMLRCVMEQTAIFLGLASWKECLRFKEDDPQRALAERIINVMSHGDYLILEPDELMDKYKDDFRAIVALFKTAFPFSPGLFTPAAT